MPTFPQVQTILDDKLSLELEIASYKQLLDSEEGRISERMDVALLEQGRYNARLAQKSMLESQMGGGVSGGASFGCGGGASGGFSFQSGTDVRLLVVMSEGLKDDFLDRVLK